MLCDRRMPIKVKKVSSKKQLQDRQCSIVVKVGPLKYKISTRWCCRDTDTKMDMQSYKIKNENIPRKVQVARIEDKTRESRLKWFGHVLRQPTDTLVCR